jgi:hypothetical protein
MLNLKQGLDGKNHFGFNAHDMVRKEPYRALRHNVPLVSLTFLPTQAFYRVREEGMALPQAVPLCLRLLPEPAHMRRKRRRWMLRHQKEMKKRILTDTCVAGGVL